VLLAAILLGGETLEKFLPFGKGLSDENHKTIARKLLELLKNVQGWDDALCQFLAFNF